MLKYILQHILLDTLYFPLWWYTRGLKRVLNWAGVSIKDMERTAGIKIWISAMFKPMFQDYTRSGRIISFFMRVVLLIFKLIIFVVWTIFVGCIIVVWMALPIITVWLIFVSWF